MTFVRLLEKNRVKTYILVRNINNLTQNELIINTIRSFVRSFARSLVRPSVRPSALVLYTADKKTAVVKKNDIKYNKEGNNEGINVLHGRTFYKATIIEDSDDKEWLERLSVSEDGKIHYPLTQRTKSKKGVTAKSQNKADLSYKREVSKEINLNIMQQTKAAKMKKKKESTEEAAAELKTKDNEDGRAESSVKAQRGRPRIRRIETVNLEIPKKKSNQTEATEKKSKQSTAAELKSKLSESVETKNKENNDNRLTENQIKRKRGRPRKIDVAEAKSIQTNAADVKSKRNNGDKLEDSQVKPKRKRQRKNDATESTSESNEATASKNNMNQVTEPKINLNEAAESKSNFNEAKESNENLNETTKSKNKENCGNGLETNVDDNQIMFEENPNDVQDCDHGDKFHGNNETESEDDKQWNAVRKDEDTDNRNKLFKRKRRFLFVDSDDSDDGELDKMLNETVELKSKQNEPARSKRNR